MKHKNSGFALLEVLISVLIMSFGVLALAKFQANLHTGHSTASNRTIAQGLGLQVVNAEAINFAATGETSAVPANPETVAGKSKNAAFTRIWTATLDGLGNSVIESTVSWTNSRGQNDFVKVATLVAKDAMTEEAKLVASPPPPMTGSAAPPATPKTPPWLVTTGNPTPATPTPTPNPPPTEPPPPEPLPPPVTYTITGAITLHNSARDNATWRVAAAGATCDNMPTNSSRPTSYSCTVNAGWSGAVTTTVTNGRATPASTSYANVTANKVLNIEIRN